MKTYKKVSLFALAITLPILSLGASGCPWLDTDEDIISGSSAPLASAVSNLNAVAVSMTQINLTWQDNSNNEDGVAIERRVELGTYVEIDTVEANVTGYSDNSLTPGTVFYYRIRAYNIHGYSMYSNVAFATTHEEAEQPPSLQVTSPIDGAILTVDDYPTIQWTKPVTTTTVKIEFYKDKPTPGWAPIATGVTGTTYTSWQVPDEISPVPGNPQAKIRITDEDRPEVWDEATGIKIQGALGMVGPGDAPNQSYVVGANRPISWTRLAGSVAMVNLYYRIGAEPWQDIAPGLNAADLVYNGWNIPDRITSPDYNVEVKIEDAYDSTVSATGTYPFKIKGDLYVTYPDIPGIEIDVGTVVTVTWETTGGSMENVRLMLSTDSGASFPTEIVASTPATYTFKAGVTYRGRYAWDTTTAPIDSECRIRVMDVTDQTSVRDKSDNDFRFK